MRLLSVAASMLLMLCSLTGQDSIFQSKKSFFTKAILPATLITTGLIVNKKETKTGFRQWLLDNGVTSTTNIDDYLQHAPIAMLYMNGLASKTDRRELGRQSRHLLISQVFTLSTVYFLKTVTKETRPNGGSRAFPSGHTAYAFASADVFYHALKDNQPILAYAGYIPALATGVYRLTRDKHWISDVLVGAGIGMLFSRLTYHLNIWNTKKAKTSVTALKDRFSIRMSQHGVGLTVQLATNE